MIMYEQIDGVKYSITICHIKNAPKDAFRCDRSSPLGNPFPMRNNTYKERIRVCTEYEEYFIAKNLQATPYFMEILQKLIEAKHVSLACWCSPKRCHTEVIARFLLAALKEVTYDV